MLLSSEDMRRFGIIGVCLFALAVWAQLLAPLAAERMGPGVDPFSVICSHASSGEQGSDKGPATSSHVHHCCSLCHAYLGSVPLNDRPAFTRFDYPVASPRRWQLVASPAYPKRLWRSHRPRDPPVLV